MSAAALLSELRAAGVILAANGDKLAIDARPGILTPELTARLKAAKPELMAILGSSAANDGDTEPAQDLPLMAAIEEFERLCARLNRTRNKAASPYALMSELPILRAHVERR